MMTPETIKSIQANSCVAVLPPDAVQQIIEVGAPTQFVRLTPDCDEDDDSNLIRLAAWGQMSKKWPSRSMLRVRFMNGSKKQRDLAVQRIREVDSLCPGLMFKQVTSGPSEIRIAFNEDLGHWSYLGTDCRFIPQNQQTMNIGLSDRDSPTEWNRVVRHETFHAIGFNHEHQHPRGSIPWNREAVYEFYGATQGWSRAEIDAQVLNRSKTTNFFGSAPDKDSIMMYPIDRRLVLDKKFAVGWNTNFSPLDISTAKRVYA